jgi:rsbT antagonist protein RsbS
VPVLVLGDVLLVTLQGELHDGTAEQLQQDIVERIARSGASGVVIDISGVEIVDSFLGRVLAEIAASAALMAARTVLAGMRPAVAITRVELGLPLPSLTTALDVERAMELLSSPPADRTRAVDRAQAVNRARVGNRARPTPGPRPAQPPAARPADGPWPVGGGTASVNGTRPVDGTASVDRTKGGP